MLNLTINNKPVEVAEGTTVLNAARQAGIDIPTLCDHPHLTPFGGCRLCMVEIDGFRTLQSACTIPATNNMVVRTDTEKVKAARKFVLTLIFSERNHFCPYCQVSGGDCELQNAAYGEGMTHWPLPPNWQPYPVDASHPYFILEHNRCILCRRCIRACSELVGINTLGVEERGAKTVVIADLNVPLGQSTCVSCGMCIQVCPTGALIDRKSAYLGQEKNLTFQNTICVGCSLGCGIRVGSRNGQAIRIEGNWDAAINDGITCKVGRFEPLFDDRQRLTTPLVRKNGSLVPAGWAEAFETIAGNFGAADQVAAAVSTRQSAETLNVFKHLFTDGLKSTMVTSLEEGAATSVASRLAASTGAAFEGTLEDVKHADSFVIFNADLVRQHELAGFFFRRSMQAGAPLVIIDSADNTLDSLANCTLTPKVGKEMDLVAGLTAAIARLGQNKTEYSGDPIPVMNAASASTGVSTDLLLEAAFKFASASKPVVVYDAAKVASVELLQALVKLAEISGAALVSLKGGANSLAAAQYGLDKPFSLNGHKAAYIVLGDEIPTERLIKTLEKAPFLVVQASHASRLTANADVVLPVASWLEQGGHYLSAGGQLQKAEVSVPAAGKDVHTNEEALRLLAKSLSLDVTGNWQAELLQRPSPVEIAA